MCLKKRCPFWVFGSTHCVLHITSDEILQTSLFGVNGSTDYASDNLITHTHTQVDPFEMNVAIFCIPLCSMNKRIDRLCCAVHNLSIRLLRTVWGYTIWPQKWYCDKWDFAGIRANQNLSIQKLKMGTSFENLQNLIFCDLKSGL